MRRLRQAGALLVCALAPLAAPSGCQSLKFFGTGRDDHAKERAAQPPALPNRFTCRVSQFVFVADFELKPDLPLFAELSQLRDQVYKELQLPPANTLVQVYLFEDRERYQNFMRYRYPELPKRRAFFVAQPHNVGGAEDLLVYTYWGDRIQQDLRHELTHALLHSVLKDVPLWLDEGLAEYFELPPDRKGVNAAHVEQLRRGVDGPCKPSLARLEQLSQVSQMTPAEYREAWAWTHLMLNDKGDARKVLLEYLQQLRTTPTAGALAPRLASVWPLLEDTLEKHLARLDADLARGPTAQR